VSDRQRNVAESIRPHLEYFIRVAYPQYLQPGGKIGQFRELCERNLGSPQEILNENDTNELGELLEYAHLFHHDTNPAWQNVKINDTELLGFVRRTLAFVKR